MKKLSRKEFKDHTVKMLVEFTDFLEKNNLRYVLDYGTLLGCIRHKGYIPWDDDIDLAMPREDYEKMCNILKSQDYTISGTIKLGDVRSKYSTHTFFGKVVDVNTLAEDKLRLEKFRYPIWIDIFPYDKTPKDLKVIMETKDYYDKTVANAMYPLFPHENQNIVKKIASKMLEPFVDTRLNAVRKKVMALQSLNKSNYYFDFANDLKSCREYGSSRKSLTDFCYDKKFFDDFIYKEFEGHKFRVPKAYDAHLKDLFGNYMELPPKEKQIAHTISTYILDKD